MNANRVDPIQDGEKKFTLAPGRGFFVVSRHTPYPRVAALARRFASFGLSLYCLDTSIFAFNPAFLAYL